MSIINEDHARRLDRAQRQYENLLMHAGEVLVDRDEINVNDSFTSETYEQPYRTNMSSPVRSFHKGKRYCCQYSYFKTKLNRVYSSIDSRRFQQTPVFDRTVSQLNDSLYDENPLTDADKDGIIVSLQVGGLLLFVKLLF